MSWGGKPRVPKFKLVDPQNAAQVDGTTGMLIPLALVGSSKHSPPSPTLAPTCLTSPSDSSVSAVSKRM